MTCAYCKSDIDNDSFYCDQCSKELFICPTCGNTGKGKNCVEHGSKLFSPKQKSVATNDTEITNKNNNIISNQPNAVIFKNEEPLPINNQKAGSLFPSSIPILKISNNHLNIDININDGAIIGRTSGEYASIFGQFSQISGKHVQFIFDKQNGWTLKDLGSTNGSAISSTPNWQNVPKLNSDKQTVLLNNSFLLIANIEFQIKIILQQSSTGTQRL